VFINHDGFVLTQLHLYVAGHVSAVLESSNLFSLIVFAGSTYLYHEVGVGTRDLSSSLYIQFSFL